MPAVLPKWRTHLAGNAGRQRRTPRPCAHASPAGPSSPSAALLATGLAVPSLAADAAPTTTTAASPASPSPAATSRSQICCSLYQPAGASKAAPVPLVMHSHGWGGSRTTGRGVVRHLARQGLRRPVVRPARLRRERRQGARREPRLRGPGRPASWSTSSPASTGWPRRARTTRSSAPSAARTAAATSSSAPSPSCATSGRTRFDALAPEITWFDLKESLAPHEVARSDLAGRCCTPPAPRTTPQDARRGLRLRRRHRQLARHRRRAGRRPGRVLREERPRLARRQGRKLDIPVLFGQGITDNLFNLNQGLKNFDQALTQQGPRQEHLRRLQRRPRPAERPARRLRHRRRPVLDARSAASSFERAGAALHAGEPQGHRHRPHRPRPVPPVDRGGRLRDASTRSSRTRRTTSAPSPPDSRRPGVAHELAAGPLTSPASRRRRRPDRARRPEPRVLRPQRRHAAPRTPRSSRTTSMPLREPTAGRRASSAPSSSRPSRWRSPPARSCSSPSPGLRHVRRPRQPHARRDAARQHRRPAARRPLAAPPPTSLAPPGAGDVARPAEGVPHGPRVRHDARMSETTPELRVGDTERRAVDDRLMAAVGDGVLTLAEYDERAAVLWQSTRTRSDLGSLTADLPEGASAAPPAVREAPAPARAGWSPSCRRTASPARRLRVRTSGLGAHGQGRRRPAPRRPARRDARPRALGHGRGRGAGAARVAGPPVRDGTDGRAQGARRPR